MKLTEEEQGILGGSQREMAQRFMRLLVSLGQIYGAKEMIAISSAQISGVSYKSIGDPGLEFLKDLADSGVKVRVPTFLNPAGIDLKSWRELKFPADFAEKQREIMEAFTRMGVVNSATCTPYLVGNLPRFKEHLAWAESSAVSFANSVIGARTNREGGPSALAAAILGFTPKYGMHLDEERRPQVVVEVTARLRFNSDFGALGHYVGRKVQNKIPYFRGIKSADIENLKALGAAMAATGAVALYHVEDITPEAQAVVIKGLEKIQFGQQELKEVYAALNSGQEPDLAVTGCPHASLKEIMAIAAMLKGKRLKKPFWICTSRLMKDLSQTMGLNEIIEEAGGRIVADTCMVVSPIEDMGYKTTAVDSGKAAQYLPGFCRQNVVFQTIEDLIEGCL